MREIIQILMAALGSVGFAMLFQLHGRKLIIAGIGGGISWIVYLLVGKLGNDMLALFCASFVVASIAEVGARIQKTPVLVLEVPMLIPLIPGADLYRLMFRIISLGIRNSMDYLVRLSQEVLLIAVSIILVSTIVSVIVNIHSKIVVEIYM